jgi:type II secretory pathway pseudopilin PulG
MLVALVIMAILTTVLWQLIRSQSAFVASEGQREEAQENARASLDIITSDLRAATPTGIVTAKDTVLELALPRAWGVTCAASTATSLTAVFPGLPSTTFTVDANGGTGLMANSSATSTPSFTPRPTLTAARPQVTAAASVAVAANCPNAAGTTPVAYQFTGTNFPVVAAGTLVMLYQMIRYDVAQSSGAWWIRRSNGMASGGTSFSMQPMAGPLLASDSLHFTYYTGATATQVAAPGGTTATIDSLSRIKVKVSTVSSSSYNGKINADIDSATVQLRNRTRSLSCGGGPSPC